MDTDQVNDKDKTIDFSANRILSSRAYLDRQNKQIATTPQSKETKSNETIANENAE